MGMIKYLLFIFNFIFVLCGLAILVVGILVEIGNHNYSKHLEDITNNLKFPAITLIVVGSIIFIIAFLGCCGAIRENYCMVVTFACLLLTILIIQVAISIYVFVTVKNFDENDFKKIYTENLFLAYNTGNQEQKSTVDAIQETLKCCGIEHPQDFTTRLGIPIPGSCCSKQVSDICSPLEAYNEGCVTTIVNIFKSALTVLGGVALGIAAAELIGIIFALCLANSVKNAERRGYSV